MSPEDLKVLATMGKELVHPVPDQSGITYGDSFAFQHNRLAIIDIKNGKQPMTASFDGYEYTIAYNGELCKTYNK